MTTVDARRVRARNDRQVATGPVLYWMERDQRVEDNWALLYAQEVAERTDAPLIVLYTLCIPYGAYTLRQYDFLLRGLEQVEADLCALNIPFTVIVGEPTEVIPSFVSTHGIGQVVVDFNPLRTPTHWRDTVAQLLAVRVTEVDAHNIIPCWVASEKQEFAAHTFRPKVHRLLKEFDGTIPAVKNQEKKTKRTPIDWQPLRTHSQINTSVKPVDWLEPGTAAGHVTLKAFIDEKLARYDTDRNDPTKDALSNLSPYLHFGQISAQRVAHEVASVSAPRNAKEAYLEELIVRRELSDNYCFYNANYDQVGGAHAWAQETIAEHAGDKREYVYDRDTFESAVTHDLLWNAMQVQLVTTGKLHGWARMYWAKKILEWTRSAQEAIDIALYLNDRYELDGTDPNGIVGVMWSVAGVHDRAWTERPVFGKIRYMNYNGAKRKFDVAAYIDRYGTQDELLNTTD